MVDLCGSLCQVLLRVSDAAGDEPPTERVTDQSLRVSLCTKSLINLHADKTASAFTNY